MKISVKMHKLRRRGNLRGFIEHVQKVADGPSAVKVGLPAGKSPASIVQIGVWNHFGTGGSQTGFVRNGVGGFGGPIPPRPFITVAMFKNRGQIRQVIRATAKAVVVQQQPMVPQLHKLGLFGQGLIQETIGGGMAPANSPLTIKIKGSSKPLVDTGQMWGSITYALDGVGGAGAGGSK